ncbi:DUF3907 family protein [Sediminibacillus massiliensis]|uniref:DUF3907 family protein n=1 Tax=Sediminibacillus massiliensis TaxID=1926277 RepID=UPI000988884F|nr:DUF3907 family protein [Sediminibacillus massiliensis]
MGNKLLHVHVKEVKDFLSKTVEEMSDYLDNHRLNDLLEENGSKDAEYYKELMKGLRRMAVFCEEALDAVKSLTRRENIPDSAVEKTLYGIYHQCILEFYSPKYDRWYENSRASYTGNHSIRFHHTPPRSFAYLMSSLEDSFQDIRESLAYYETKFQPKMS